MVEDVDADADADALKGADAGVVSEVAGIMAKKTSRRGRNQRRGRGRGRTQRRGRSQRGGYIIEL